MRALIALLALGAMSTPSLAAPRDGAQRDVRAMADRMNDPLFQAGLSGMVVAMADVMMDLRIDKLRDALATIDPDAMPDDRARTLGDVVAREDPRFRERLARGSSAAAGAMGGMASGMADMLPGLQAMAERMGREIDRATRDLPR